MKKTVASVFTLSLLLVGCASHSEQAVAVSAEAAGKMSHAHIEHVRSAWGDTPEGAGLLPTALAEAEIAAFHAGLAIKQPDNLAWLKLHTTHVMHALDPATVAQGPGKGYGVIRATEGVVKHIELAAGSADASPAVKLHAEHIATSARNTLERAQQMLTLAHQLMAAQDAATAAPLAQRMATLGNALTEGIDVNGDGEVSWQQGEGGLAISRLHTDILARMEGLSSR